MFIKRYMYHDGNPTEVSRNFVKKKLRKFTKQQTALLNDAGNYFARLRYSKLQIGKNSVTDRYFQCCTIS